jgi:flagellar motor switch/type III secretory pathway protein FliN
MIAPEHARREGTLRRLRRAARERGDAPPPPPETADFDWSRPHHFTAAGHDHLADFARRLAERLGPALARAGQGDAGFTADPPAECYPRAVAPAGAPACFVPLADAEGRRCGVLRFPASLAATWVDGLLGGASGSRGKVEALSPLEEGLLLDIAAWITEAASEVSAALGGPEVRSEGALADWPDALPVDGGEELCRFLFRRADELVLPVDDDSGADAFAADDPESRFSDGALPTEAPDDDPAADTAATGAQDRGLALVLRSAFLEPLAGAARADPPEPDEVRRRIEASLRAAALTVRADVGTASVPLGDLLALEPGDILLLERMTGETIDLTVEGHAVLRARPVISRGQYAVEIQDLRRFARVELGV